MINLVYSSVFLKRLKKLEPSLQDEVLEKINLFKDRNNHKILKVHKLHGQFSNCFSFYVSYDTRIVFEYLSKNEVALLSVGRHDIYK